MFGRFYIRQRCLRIDSPLTIIADGIIFTCSRDRNRCTSRIVLAQGNIDIGSLLTKPGIRIFGRDITCNLIIGLKVTVFCKSVRHTVPQIPFFSQRTLPVNINRITVYLLTTDYRENRFEHHPHNPQNKVWFYLTYNACNLRRHQIQIRNDIAK